MESVRIAKESYIPIGQDMYLSFRYYEENQVDATFLSVSLDTIDCSIIIKGTAFERSTHSPLQGVQVSIGLIRIGKGMIVDDGGELPVYHIISNHGQQAKTDESGQFTIWGKASPGQHLFFVYPNYKMRIYEIDKLCPNAHRED